MLRLLFLCYCFCCCCCFLYLSQFVFVGPSVSVLAKYFVPFCRYLFIYFVYMYMRKFGDYTCNKHNISVSLDPHEMLK